MSLTARRRSFTSLAVAGFAAAAGSLVAVGSGASADQAGLILGADSPGAVDGEYIVVLDDAAIGAQALNGMIDTVVDRTSGSVKVVDQFSVINGFAAEMSPEEAADLAADGAVAYVEQNQTVTVADVQESPPSWGLDRVDQFDLPLDDAYEYDGDGSGVHAYIIDSGILTSHEEFRGRIGAGYDFVDDDSDPTDCAGHGTHVAGTVGGTNYGMAKEVTLHGVRVLDCSGSGTYEDVIAGIDWVADNHIAPAVANMSLGGGYSSAVNDAVEAAISSGVTFSIAAGNETQSACNVSPASAPDAITVAATDSSDRRAYFSNYGSCVDLFAPGLGITSAWTGSDSSTRTVSGTSMAAPHVAGAVAVYLSNNPDASTDEVATWVNRNAGYGRVASPLGSPNLLLFSGEAPVFPDEPADCERVHDTATYLPVTTVTEIVLEVDCEGYASSESLVHVDITHDWIGDLDIFLVTPDGSEYPLRRADFQSGESLVETYTVNLYGRAAEGTWTLLIKDSLILHDGTLNSWSLTV